MIFVILFTAVFTIALAGPIDCSKDAQVLRDDRNIGVEGYQYVAETSDGKSVTEEGQLKNVGTEQEAIVVRGQYSYIGDDGITYTVSYIADENGFQPIGAHLPAAPVA